jgi:hypothetical protein
MVCEPAFTGGSASAFMAERLEIVRNEVRSLAKEKILVAGEDVLVEALMKDWALQPLVLDLKRIS